MTHTPSDALATDLRRLVPHGVSARDVELTEAATDYGRVVHRRPRVIVRPPTTEDVAAIIGYARARGITVATRAAGHSQGGQSLGEQILLDTRGLTGAVRVERAVGRFEAGAGTCWREVVAAAASSGFVPPVLTTNHSTTVGGTHAVGGIGHSSFRFGTQADNCLAFEIVTGTGDVLHCSSGENDELFAHALCSLGRLGVMTRIEHRLRRFAPFTRLYELAYRDLARLLADADGLIAADRVTYVHARSAPIKDRWIHVLGLTIETDAPLRSHDDDPVLQGLGHVQVVYRTDVPHAELLRWMSAEAAPTPGVSVDVVRPGIDVVLPASIGARFIEDILRRVPRWTRKDVLPLIQFLRRSTLTRPLFVTPAAESLLLLSILPTVGPGNSAQILDLLTDISAECRRAGGKHYLAGWIPFDAREWREHFGARWGDLVRLRRQYDPDGVFADAAVPRELDAFSFGALQRIDRAPTLFDAAGLARDSADRV